MVSRFYDKNNPVNIADSVVISIESGLYIVNLLLLSLSLFLSFLFFHAYSSLFILLLILSRFFILFTCLLFLTLIRRHSFVFSFFFPAFYSFLSLHSYAFLTFARVSSLSYIFSHPPSLSLSLSFFLFLLLISPVIISFSILRFVIDHQQRFCQFSI